jgi:hypothetical protein
MRGLVILAAVVVLAGGGFYEVTNTLKKADAKTIAEAQAKLDAIPLTLGDWTGEVQQPDLKQADRAGAFALTTLFFKNEKLNEGVSVLILVGPSGEIGAHDPNRCYAGAGYRSVGTQERRDVVDETNVGSSFWSARFDTDTFPAIALNVRWAWSLDGTWTAAENARYEFVREPVLYKIYASRRLNTLANASQAGDPTDDFLQKFVPAVRSALKSKN